MSSILAAVLTLAAVAALALCWRRLAAIYERDTVWAYLLSRTQWTDRPFEAALVDGLPDAAQRYFLAAIAEGTPLRTVAVIRTTAELAPAGVPVGLRGDQMLAARQGAVWRFRATGSGLPFSGFVSLHDGRSRAASWSLGLLPSSRLSGWNDPARLSQQMLVDAMLWTPAAILLEADAAWTEIGRDRARAVITTDTATIEIEIAVDAAGQLTAIGSRVIDRDAPECSEAFTMAAPSDFRTIDGYTVPHIIAFDTGGGDRSLLGRVKLDDVRYAGPWIGSSHS